MKLQFCYPVKPVRVNQVFGNPDPKYVQLGLKGHNGIDFAALRGQPVYASHDGIAYVGVDVNEGHGVVVRTKEEYDYNGGSAYFKTIYWHLLPNIPIMDGKEVQTGELLGYANSTGFSTGDHLHFGLKPQGFNESNNIWYNVEQTNGFLGAIDPSSYFNGFYAQDAQVVVSLLKKVVLLIQSLFKGFQ